MEKAQRGPERKMQYSHDLYGGELDSSGKVRQAGFSVTKINLWSLSLKGSEKKSEIDLQGRSALLMPLISQALPTEYVKTSESIRRKLQQAHDFVILIRLLETD